MKTYLLSILAASLGSSLLFHLLPEKSSCKKGLQFLSVLLLLLLLLSPLTSAKEALTEFFSSDWSLRQEALQESYREKSQQSLLAHSKDYLEKHVKEKLTEQFSIREEDLSVRVLLEEGEPKKVVLVLSGKAIWQDSARMETFVEELTGLPSSSVIE